MKRFIALEVVFYQGHRKVHRKELAPTATIKPEDLDRLLKGKKVYKNYGDCRETFSLAKVW